VTALERYAAIARGLGADEITFLGTEPIRRAADAAAIVHDVIAATGLPLHVLSHEEEAYLTIVGVTEGQPVTHETLVVDIGGGSSELCVVDAAGPPRAIGLRLGSARLTDRFVTHDPPLPAEIEAMYAAALDSVGDAPPSSPVEIVAVGGTASNLRKVVATTRDVLGQDDIARAMMLLGSMPAAEATERYAINPIRARILSAGAAILAAILDHYGVAEVRVSEAGIREGAILAVAHAGPAWRDRLVELTRGWRA
jgi:exopolyphosphatase/guanosine-5'-triphosphate,3'-diphosphate pyrophosphatase